MRRSELTLLTLLIFLVALTLFATVGFEIHHLLSHLEFGQAPPQ